MFYQERVIVPVPKPSVKSRRKQEAKVKAILHQKYTELWQNSQKLFQELDMLHVPHEQIQRLMSLLYTGQFESKVPLPTEMN